MTNLGKGPDLSCTKHSFMSYAAPAACLLVLGGTLAMALGGSNDLVAESGTPDNDLDDDGLVAQMEYILGTDDMLSDSDFDGFSDLEEIARGSNPLIYNSKPNSNPLGAQLFAYANPGILTFQTVAFVQGSDLTGLTLEAGIVNKMGQSLIFGPDVINMATFASQPAANPADMIVIMTLPIAQPVVSKMGQLNFFTRMQDTGPVPRPPVVNAMTIVDDLGVLFEIQDSPVSVMEGDGVIYRPLTGPDDPAPASATTGQVCWQDISPVGSNGNLLEYEIVTSSCQSFDAFCSSAGCTSSFGTPVTLVDPGSLLGG